MELVFNELSTQYNEMHDKVVIRKLFSDWIAFLSQHLNDIDVLWAEDTFYYFSVNSVYGIREWLNDPNVPKKEKQMFRTFQNIRLHVVDFKDYQKRICFQYGEEILPAPCGAAADELESPLLSLATDKAWDKNEIYGYRESEEESLRFENITCESHYADFAKRVIQNQRASVNSGQDLWEQQKALFPNLIFCRSVKDDLERAPHKAHIQRIIWKLVILDQYYGRYAVYQMKKIVNARTESDSVKNDPKLKKERLFTKPDGTKDYFYDHISFAGDYSGRIHYLPDDRIKKIYIGYIGKHLPTEKYG